MRVVFLDVDGVLNRFGFPDDYSIYWENCSPPFSKSSVELLQRLVNEEWLTIVLSSTWRIYQEDFDSLTRFLKLYGLEIFDKTPSIWTMHNARGREIASWLSDHPEVTDYIIIDDENDMGNLETKLVQTSGSKGFIYKNYLDAKQKLAKE